MRKLMFTIIAMVQIAVSFAGVPVKKDSNPPGYKKQYAIPKGPDYKNRLTFANKLGERRAVYHGIDDSRKGVDFKNRRVYSENIDKVIVKSVELKGPEFKNRMI
jgi:hypothetical protein